MIKLLKKHKYKLLTLMLSIVSIFTLFLGVNKTYAYETDNFSYTINSITNTSTNEDIQLTTLNNKNGFIYEYTSNQFLYQLNTDYNNFRNKYFLINYYLLDSNNNFVYSQYGGSYNLSFNLYYYLSANNTSGYFTIANNQGLTNNYSNDYMFTSIGKFSYVSNNSSLPLPQFYLYIGGLNNLSMYRVFIINIDIVEQYDIGLSQYYETYYGQIEDNYNELLSDYNDLQDNYDTLEVQYGDLQDDYEELENDYDTLENNYNDLNGNINNLNDFYNYGFIAFMKNGYVDSNDNVYSTRLTVYYVDRNSNTFLIKEYPLTLNDISSYFGGSSFSLYDLANHYIDLLKDSITNFNDLYYIDSCNLFIELQALFNIEYIDFINYEFTYDMELFIRNSIDNIAVYFNQLDTNNTNINSTKILEKNNNLKQFNTIEFDNISYDSDFYEPFITFNNVASAYYNNGVNDGYQRGLQQGRDSQQSIINDLTNQVNDLNNQVDSLERSNRVLQEQINSFSSDYNLNNLMWTIASTPFESFKQIWNVNFFGVNISTMITGFITGLIVLWIIKKFFL